MFFIIFFLQVANLPVQRTYRMERDVKVSSGKDEIFLNAFNSFAVTKSDLEPGGTDVLVTAHNTYFYNLINNIPIQLKIQNFNFYKNLSYLPANNTKQRRVLWTQVLYKLLWVLPIIMIFRNFEMSRARSRNLDVIRRNKTHKYATHNRTLTHKKYGGNRRAQMCQMTPA